MDQNLKDAKANLGNAKDDVKDMVTEHLEAAKKNVGEHLENASDATKDAIVDMANSVKKAADAVIGKLHEPKDPLVKE